MTSRDSGRRPASADRRDRLIRERQHDPYKLRGKLSDPTACPECGVMYRGGRWIWGAPPVDAHQAFCPACRRIRDEYPAGLIRLAGAFAQAHRAEVLGLARNVEEREKRAHPLKRIMVIREEAEGVLITTTDAGLARNIGDALQRAYEGELEYQYTDEESLLRVSWRR